MTDFLPLVYILAIPVAALIFVLPVLNVLKTYRVDKLDKLNEILKTTVNPLTNLFNKIVELLTPENFAKYIGICLIAYLIINFSFNFSENFPEIFFESYHVDFFTSFFRWIIREFTNL